MAKNTEELIEKPVVSKRGRPRKTDAEKAKSSKTKKAKKSSSKTKKVATKKATKTTKKTATKVLENPVIQANSALQISSEKKIAKRTIKNISSKSSSNNEPIVEKTVVNSNAQKRTLSLSTHGCTKNAPSIDNKSKIEKTISKNSKNKRTLRLNLNSNNTKKEQNSIQEQTPEISIENKIDINQNSIFFNSPSIFSKFDIDFTATDIEEILDIPSIEPNNETIETEIQADLESDIESNNFTNLEKINKILEKVQAEDEEYDFISNVINNSLYDSNNQESNSIEYEEEYIETNSIEDDEHLEIDSIEDNKHEHIETNSIEDDDISILDESIFDDSTLDEILLSTSLDDFDSDQSILDESINLDEINLEDLTDSSNVDIIKEHISVDDIEDFKQVANTIIEDSSIQNNSDKSPVGKFFDSSIPSMTSSENTFSKIKESSNSIFKKFTFEEANLINNKNNEIFENTITPNQSNVVNISKSIENFIPNVQDQTNITENADSVNIISIPVIDQTVKTNLTDTVTENPVITNQPNYYDDLENPEDYEFTNKLINKITNEDIDDYEETDLTSEESIEEESVTENNNEFVEENNINETNLYDEIDYNNISSEDLKRIQTDNYNDETFSIESYFGISDDFATKFLKANNTNIQKQVDEEKDNLEEFFEDEVVTEETSITNLENNYNISSPSLVDSNTTDIDDIISNLNIEDINLEDLDITDLDLEETENNLLEENNLDEPSLIELNNTYTNTSNEDLTIDDINDQEINFDDIDLNDIDLEDFNEFDLSSEPIQDEQEASVESIISNAFLSKDFSLDSTLKNEFLLEMNSNTTHNESFDASSDFMQIIDSLTKAITELEQSPDINLEQKESKKTPSQQILQKEILMPPSPPTSLDLPTELISNTQEDKAINILINKDDIFSISILNETYEIVADFDGISVLSENIHISTPKNNFFVKVGNKYIEIHNKESHFILNTNFEDIEFANAINNITFAKKDNKIELNIKEAFKLSSINNKIEVSMLNKAIADLSNNSTTTNSEDDSSSICDNKTLLISEETQKVYLPYTIEDIMKKLKTSDEYQTIQEIIDNEYTLPLSTFKMPIISRFKEAYRFMRTKENSSVYAAVDLAIELMFNSNLNPAVIRAAKDLKELNIYLDCLYENEVEKFDCFKIIYKVLPKIK